MTISWFEIIAQIINFFIILFILQRLLYKPVLKVMEQRQERIQKAQIEADRKMREAQKLMDRYEKKIENIQKERVDILDDARTQAQQKRERLLNDYIMEAESKRHAYLKEIEDEKDNFKRRLRQNLGESAVKIAAHILNMISYKELESEVFNTFILNLRNVKQNIPDLEDLKKEQHVQVRSYRDLSQHEKTSIEEALKGQLRSLEEIHYETDPELILGYELFLETYTVHTNIRNYLTEIEKEIIKSLDSNG
ncbi:F-type H+-transporting ATPase subunit b [Alkalibacterium subtropicum]|uniref:ATP synthase subunit b n=1 Tax=Alkalibacterium subtropicum TaxID=753702 RepID=A0A1I1HRS4_9LACT|nr:hypothetical protein [Alkalibacterium subtropicum]SFC24668.1 F-type H+-transporting ATPase subunit b [Alkalibacterium subtropicum]